MCTGVGQTKRHASQCWRNSYFNEARHMASLGPAVASAGKALTDSAGSVRPRAPCGIQSRQRTEGARLGKRDQVILFVTHLAPPCGQGSRPCVEAAVAVSQIYRDVWCAAPRAAAARRTHRQQGENGSLARVVVRHDRRDVRQGAR